MTVSGSTLMTCRPACTTGTGWTWWWEQIKQLTPGKYTVIALDTVSEIESGLCDWVNKNPAYFGHTAAQYAKMEGIYWGDVKEFWKGILADLSSRCVTFAFTAHMGDVWAKGGQGSGGPTGKRKPKGKSTLMELASLYLMLERKPDQKGEEPAKPAGVVLKDRLVAKRIGADGELELVKILPPRLPVATPAAVRKYMADPVGTRATREDELLKPELMGDDERLRLQAQIAEANRDAETLKLEQIQRRSDQQAHAQPYREPPARATHKPAIPNPQATEQFPPATMPAPSPVDSPVASPAASPEPSATASPAPLPDPMSGDPSPIRPDQVQELLQLKATLTEQGFQQVEWESNLSGFRVKSARDLTEANARSFIHRLRRRLKDFEQAPIQHANGNSQANGTSQNGGTAASPAAKS